MTTGPAGERRPGHRWAAALGCLACAVVVTAYVIAHLSTGSAPSTVLGFVATVLLGVLLPGYAVTRAVRARPGPVVEDLGWAGPTGLAVTLVLWLITRVTGVPVPSALAGPALILVLLLVPPVRRRILARTPPGMSWGPWGVSVLALSLLTVVGWTRATGLVAASPRPRAGHPDLYGDLYYQVALTAELRRALRPTYPQVAGEPLSYHWFFHAVAAQLGGDGHEDVDVVTRLLPVFLMLLVVLSAATLGAVVARRPAGGVGAAVAVGMSGPVVGALWPRREDYGLWFPVGSGAWNPPFVYWQISPTQTQAWVFGLACTALVVAAVRRCQQDRGQPLVLLPVLLLGAAGSKSSQNVALAAGMALLGLVLLLGVRRPQSRARLLRLIGAAALVGVISVGAAFVLYPGGGYGLRPAPGSLPTALGRGLIPGDRGELPLRAVVGGLLVFVPLLAQHCGLAGLGRRDPRDPGVWIALGGLGAGILALDLLTHPGGSQYYFLFSAFATAAALAGAGAAVGVVELAERPVGAAGGHRTRLLLARLGVLVAVLVAAVIRVAGPVSPLGRWRAWPWSPAVTDPPPPGLPWATAWLWPLAAAVLAVLVVSWLGCWALRARFLQVAPFVCLCAGMVAPVAVAGGAITPLPPERLEQAARGEVENGLRRATPALYAAGELVRRESAPTDVVATNRVYNLSAPPGRIRDNRDFTVSALTGLRTDVSGYGYADRIQRASAEPGAGVQAELPFWDAPRLTAEQRLIADPSPTRLADAWTRRGTRWIMADTSVGPVDTAGLDALAQRVFARGGVFVYRLRPPAGP